jgi:hypothetical protein
MRYVIRILQFCVLIGSTLYSLAQTSWKGTTSTSWGTASNWTAGVPTATIDAIIGDANFTGPNQPTISVSAKCKSLTIGGAVTSVLTIKKSATVSGNITINSNGTISQAGTSLTLTGNWINNGTYTTTSTSANAIFAGITQSIRGTATTTFRKLSVNAGSVTTLNTDVTVSGSGSLCTVKGTLNPGESPTHKLTAAALTVYVNAVLKVNGALFTDNYNVSGATTLNAGSIVEYAATAVNQTVSSSFTYSTLRISGSGTKSLAANLPALRSGSTSYGNIYVNSGTFDLAGFTADRGASIVGGIISVDNGATLKIGGTGTFPANYNTTSMSLSSTVEYNGGNQTIAAKTYGNLKISSAGGAVTKTFPATAFTIAGDFTSSAGSGTSVSYTAASAITVSGQVNIGASTTFNGSSFTINCAGNWTNNGTFTGSTSTVNMTGPGTNISGTGAHNFNNLAITASGITAAAIALNVAGNFSTTGPGVFTQATGGTLTLSGSSKTISGANITLDNVTVSGSLTTTSSLTITGNLTVSGSFTGNSDVIVMTGSTKTISGAGAIAFSSLQLTGSITALTSFSVGTALNVSGSLTASTGTVTFTGTSTLDGTANLYNVAINGSSLVLSSNAVLGIANALTITAGILNVTANIPNTVNFNGTGAQTVNAITYHHLSVTNGNTKTAANAITLNGNLTIGASTTFAAGSYTHTIAGNWINNGIFAPSTGTIQFTGTVNTAVTGATTFNILTINKSSSVAVVTLQNNVQTATINMTNGNVNTGSNTLTITSTRTGSGIILGTITRSHAFSTGMAYAFEGPFNTITFASVSGVTAVTVYVSVGAISDFPNSASINRVYTISVSGGSYNATLRLHYEDAELAGSNESGMQLSQYNGSSWVAAGKSANNNTSNYVEQSSLTNITNRWTMADNAGVIAWNGSVSSNWATAANWTTVSGAPSSPPAAGDIVQIGTTAFTNQPVINSAVTVKSIVFGSAQAATLTVAGGGSLVTNGNISGTWSANASHAISTGDQPLTVNGDLVLSDGTSGHTINLTAANGNITVNGSLTQSGGAAITVTGTAILTINNNFNRNSGTFTAGSGTVVYAGTGAQTVAPVNYNHLTVNKASGIADLNGASTVGGNLTISAGELDLDANTTVSGNVNIAASATLHGDGITLTVGGNWSNAGSFYPGNGSVVFNGNAAQSIAASTFNELTINTTAATATLAGNVTVNSNLNILGGTLDLLAYTANRSATGGQLNISNGATLIVGGANNFPQGFTANNLGSSSTVQYNGSAAQTVTGIGYGNLTFLNGGANAKTLSASVTTAGNITINSGATVNAGVYTIALYGNWSNSGTFVPSTGTLLLYGANKTITGNTTFNRVTIYGSYTVAGSDIVYNGLLTITPSGSYAAGSGTATVNGDLTNSGILTSSGTTTFTGTTLQTIRLINAISSTSTGIINFNGNVSPVLISTSTPAFYNLNINNTAGISPSVNWFVAGNMTIGSGGVFNGGSSTHTIQGNFTNNGTVSSSGTLAFSPAAPATVKLSGTSFSSTGIVVFGGTGQITITGSPTTLTNVRITNTNAAGITPPSGWVIDGDLVISNNALLNAGSYAYTIGGDIESNGALNGGSSTFTMSAAAGSLTGSPNTTFNHLTITGAIAAESDYNVAGNFTNNGSYDGTVGVLTMTGSNAGTIGGSTTPSTIAQLAVAKTGNTITTLGVNISNVSLLYINSGILSTSTYSITQDAAGGVLLISDGAMLRLGGTNSLPTFGTYGLDTNSTVDYNGSTQVVANVTPYGNLLVSAAGTKTATVPLIILNNFTLTAGTFSSAVSVTHSVGGDWNMTGGTFLNTSSTILFNGTNDQHISSTGAFYNVKISKTAGLVYITSPVTVNANLNLTAGKMSIDNNNLTISNGGSITNASAASYIIATGTGTLNQQVTAGGSTVFPVGVASYFTPATVSLTAGSATDVFSATMLPAVYLNGTSGAAITSNAVNATWMIGEATAGGSNGTVTLQWPVELELSGFNRTLSRLAHYTNSAWDYGTTDIPASGSNPYTVSRSGFTGFSPFIVTNNLNVVPVTWLSVSGTNKNNDNYIYWSTTTELNNGYFVVERTADGTHYTAIGKVNAAANADMVHNYSFVDDNVQETVYSYRIKQVDVDGRFSYSKVITIKSELIPGMTVWPNPVRDQAALTITSDKTTAVAIRVVDVVGHVIFKTKRSIAKGANQINIDLNNAAPGVYILHTIDDHGNNKAIRFIKN